MLFLCLLAPALNYLLPSPPHLGIPSVVAGGRIQGQVFGFTTFSDQLVPLEFASVSAWIGGSKVEEVWTYNGGHYEMFLPSGEYLLVIDYPAYVPQSMPVSIGEGSSFSLDFYLQYSGKPIPEISDYALPLITAIGLVISLLLLRRARKKKDE